MRKTLFGLALTILSAPKALAIDLRCEAENNYFIEVKEEAETFRIIIEDLGTHDIAKSLNLPRAHQEYAYVIATFGIPKSQCRFSATNALIFNCNDNQTSVDLSWPGAHLDLNWVNVGMTRNTVESVLGGVSEFYQLSFSVHEKTSAKQVSESFSFNIDTCHQN